ncbi:hypothetical protein BGX38DRAFT_1155299 [Terfezia claveryi]|nr:hypothetical protein BGX38DRAFT_1155299 [Terfezia claveryi]
MAAHGIKSSVYILPNPDSSEVHHRDLNNITVAQRNLTFRLNITRDILTLWLGPAQRGDDISGLAYVPTIDHNDQCYHGRVPENATQLDDLPPLNFDVIGYAPWVSKSCSRRFLDSAAADKGNTRAMVFYTVTNGKKSAVMPTHEDPMWDIGPHDYQFPIYAINGVDGEPLMEKVAKYSRNITDIWDSPSLKDTYDIGDYARVYIEVDTGMLGVVSSELA